MTTKELKEYMLQFGDNAVVSIIVADINKRIYHKISGYQFIADDELDYPVLMLETEESGCLDETVEDGDFNDPN